MKGKKLFEKEEFKIFYVFNEMKLKVGKIKYDIRWIDEDNVRCKKIKKFVMRKNYEYKIIK